MDMGHEEPALPQQHTVPQHLEVAGHAWGYGCRGHRDEAQMG